MAYGFRYVHNKEMDKIVDRLSKPTQSTRSHQYNYNAQEENLRYLKKQDPLVHPRRSVSPSKLDQIIHRLTRPTVADIARQWNYDCEDGNLMFLKMFDPNIRLRYRTVSATQERSRPISRQSTRISVEELSFFLDKTKPHMGPGHSRNVSQSSLNSSMSTRSSSKRKSSNSTGNKIQ